MKKLILICSLFFGLICSAQDTYFTIYNFTVEPQNVSTVATLFNDYFSANKPDGVTVSLYENHFNDSGNNFSHSVVFAGTLDALGGMYSGETSDTWDLFRTRINQHMKEGFNSFTGRQISIHGDTSGDLRFQRYYVLDVEDGAKFTSAHNAYAEKNVPKGMTMSMGNITLGQGPDGGNRWVIASFKDFKSALGGAYMLRTEAEREADSKAWKERRENDGDVSLVRSGLRILLMSW
ncbi:hypothetical protein [Winogradskyella aurantia]|uniref:Uncharacterized protein n=1 Tax=Winogradskyella aurantia TaxID=1915063 RepID=A0A265UUX0_9FLAO|nr:hypothetical protein [Winogradskyella aurantia]OZV69109.1 hypothetical protein CA834_06520 [Winogradskyella aurantia]